MNEEDNNIENTENMKTVIVAQDGSGDYESIQEVLFFENSKQNLLINVKRGYYYGEDIVINREGETKIVGSKGVFLSDSTSMNSYIISIIKGSVVLMNIHLFDSVDPIYFINIESEESVTIHNCSFEVVSEQPFQTLINLKASHNVFIFNSIFVSKRSESLIIIEKTSTLVLSNNTIIGVNNVILFSKDYDFLRLGLIRNIFSLIYGIFEIDTDQHNISEIIKSHYVKEQFIFEKNINIVEDEIMKIVYNNISDITTNLLQTNISFKNEEKKDFRIEDPRYKDFGASEETILFFMDNEEEQNHKPKKYIKDFLIYIDTSLFKKDFEDFVIELKKESEIKNIIPIYSAEELKEQKEISTLVLVSPVDKSENENEIFEVLEEAKKLKKDIFIFLADIKKHTGDKMNFAKMPQVLETHNKLKEEENVSFYENTEQLEEIIYQRLQSSFPKVALEKLKIKNIGHFSELEIDFEESNQNAYCFIGTNGTGKTSILRAIILGLIGISSKALDKNELQNLVKIYGIENENIKRENAFIELHYLVDNKRQQSKIVCEIGKDGTLEWKNEGSFALLDEPFLESLVIAFSQLRGERGNNGNFNKEISRQLRPHISDVLPLVHNEVDKRLSDFSRWIIDLYAKANEKQLDIQRKTNKKETEIIERTTINLVFEIISELLDQNIRFKEVRENKEVWICTEMAENGIPITLVSQGFNTIIGWIGGLLQRMQEVYGLHALGRKKEFRTYPAFCVIDELDPHLHPKVQANLMNVLKKYFPNTLFVFSTHSPLIIPYLEKENVFMLTQDGQVSNAHIHTKGRSYQSILLDFMNVSERPKEYADKLDILYRLIDDENIEEAKKRLTELILDFGENDPEILRAQTMIHFIED